MFYGWWIVLASSAGLSANPGQFAYGALGIFMIPLSNEFGWDRAHISLTLTIFTAALAVSLPIVGRLVDRHGSREVLLPSLVVFGLLLGVIPLAVSKLWHLWLIFLLIGSIGAGANALPYLRIIGAWFNRRRGLAYGLAMAGGGLGYTYVPPMLQYLNDHYGWRTGYYALSAIVIFVAIPLVWAVLRNEPRQVGMYADGDSVEPGPAATGPPDFALGDLLRSSTFWLLFTVFLVISLCMYGLLLHLVPMLIDRGMSSEGAALAASTLGGTIVVSRAFIGYLVDRFFAPRVAMVSIILSGAGLAMLAGGAVNGAAYFAAALAGLSIGAEIDLLAYLATRYFGLGSFGLTYGLLFTGFLLGTAVGPVAYGKTFDVAGSYAPVLAVCSVLMFVTAAVLLRLPRYVRN